MKLLGLQYDIAWEDKAANYRKVNDLLETAAPEPGSLIVLPEMFATGFSMNVDRVAEPYGGPTEQFLSQTAAHWKSHLVAGLPAQGPDRKARNKGLVYGPDGRLIAWYAKQKLFSPGDESLHYAAGDRPCVFTWAGLRVSLFICYDLRFPELFRKVAAESRPELFLVIANWLCRRETHWPRLLQARAIENQAYVLAVNRIGSDPTSPYCGRSLFIDPHGEIVADAGTAVGCIEGALDLPALEKYRSGFALLDDLTA